MQPAAGAVGNDRIRIDQMDDVSVRAWQAGGFFLSTLRAMEKISDAKLRTAARRQHLKADLRILHVYMKE